MYTRNVYYLILSPLILLAVRTITHIYSSTLIDFSMYLTATNFFLAGSNPYLAIAPQVYPPAFLFLMIPFALIPVHLARLLWTTLSLLSFALSIHLLLNKLSLKFQIFLGLLALQLFPVKFALAQGQINLFVFLGFILIYHFFTKGKDFFAGLALALIAIMKVNPVLLIFYFLILKRYRLIVYCLICLIFLNLAIDLPSSHNLIQSFFEGTIFRIANPPLYYYNQSLPTLLCRLNLSSLSIFTSIAILLTTIVAFFKHTKNTQQFFSLFIITILLISPITWQHYLFWTIPAFVYLLHDSQKPRLILTTVALILINFNFKNPIPFTQMQFVYSHATFGLLTLYFLVLNSRPTPFVSPSPHAPRRRLS